MVLLRQYRSLIEDYKAFHRLYLKRANYLVALKMLSRSEVTQPELFLVTTMLSEDLTGRLKVGETTEGIVTGAPCGCADSTGLASNEP